MDTIDARIKRNIKIFYISEMSRAAILFQTAIWYGYEKQFMPDEKIAFYGALIIIFDVLFQLPTGAFADIFGKKLTLILGDFIGFLGPLILGLFPSEAGMLLFALCYGIGNAFMGGTYSALLYNMLHNAGKVEMYPAIKANGSILFQWFGSVFIVIGSYAYTIWQPLPYILFAIGFLISSISAFFLFEFEDKNKTEFNLKAFLKKNWLGFKEVFKNSKMARLTLAIVFMCAIAFGSQRFLSVPYMTELGLDAVTIGWLGMGYKVLSAFLGYLIIKKTNWVKHKYFILIIPAVMLFSMIPARYFGMPVSIIFLLGIAFSSANADLFMSPVINSYIDSGIRTTALSAINMLTSISNSFIQIFSAPFLAASKVGNYYQLLGIFSAVIILPMMLSIMGFRKANKSADLSLVGD